MRVNIEDGGFGGKVLVIYTDDGSMLGEMPVLSPERGRIELEDLLESVGREAVSIYQSNDGFDPTYMDGECEDCDLLRDKVEMLTAEIVKIKAHEVTT